MASEETATKETVPGVTEETNNGAGAAASTVDQPAENDKPAESASTEASATTEKTPETGEKEVKLYIGNLPDDCPREKLKELFDQYGKVTQCDKVKNFAFVHMLGEQAAKDAVSGLNDKEFMGTHLQVQFARSKGKPSEDECFECGKHGHWARDCARRRSRFERGRFHPYDRYDRPPPRRPYDYPPPQSGRYYDDYYRYDRQGGPPGRDPYYNQGGGYSYPYRSNPTRQSPPRFTGSYEGYRSAYEGRSLAVFSGGTVLSGVAKATQCDGGVCCDNGRFRAAQTVCRARRDECDVAEFCNGTHGSCPSDGRVSDGESCAGGKGRCLEGKCAPASDNIEAKKRKRSLHPVDEHGHTRGFVRHHNRKEPKVAKKEGLQVEVIILLSVLLPLAILTAVSVTVWLWYTKRLCFDKPIQSVSYHELARTRQQSKVLDHPNIRYDICPDDQ